MPGTGSEAPLALDHYRLLGPSGLRVSPLCLGAMTFGTDWGWGADADTSRRIFEIYAEAGGNFIDTANFYTNGTSEKLCGEFIASDRERFVLATKYTLGKRRGDPNAGGNHRKNMVQAIEASLKRLKTDYIDLYWLHVWDWTTPIEEVMRAFDDLVRAGKVLHVGASDTPAWKVAQGNAIASLRGWAPFVAIQVPYHLAQRDIERELVPMCRESGLAICPWAPLAGGILTGKYTRKDLEAQERGERGEVDPFDTDRRMLALTEKKLEIAETVQAVAKEIGRTPAQVAINWVLAQPGMTSPIIGARSIEQLQDNLKTLEFALAPEHLTRLDEVSAIQLGFPLDFINAPFVRSMIHCGTSVEVPQP
ncbi:MAG: aldo/keto reductase [Planctomycetota bacterium]